MPTRIQRSRAGGYKQPANTHYCGRPGKWGNPFVCVETTNRFVVFVITHPAFRGFCQSIKDQHGTGVFDTKQKAQAHAVFLFGKLMDQRPELYPVQELAGYEHLSCWCALDAPCHVDEILRRIE